jgi:hypothetical protein
VVSANTETIVSTDTGAQEEQPRIISPRPSSAAIVDALITSSATDVKVKQTLDYPETEVNLRIRVYYMLEDATLYQTGVPKAVPGRRVEHAHPEHGLCIVTDHAMFLQLPKPVLRL